jgi:hypothetical protein
MEDNPNAQLPEENAGQDEEDARTYDPASEPITRERIAERAYLISQSHQAGTDEENWLRAERELREEQELQEG